MKNSPFPKGPSFKEALRFWFKLGWISFGGTAGHIAIMHDYLVEKRKWVSNGLFFHALSLCMLLPGPEAQQLAIYIGWKLHGKKGGIVAGTLFVLPSMLILMIFSIVYVKYGALPVIMNMLGALKPAVIALLVAAVAKVGRKSITTLLQLLTATMAFAASFYYNISLPIIITGTIILALMILYLRPGLLPKNGNIRANGEDDPVEDAKRPDLSFSFSIREILFFSVLWVSPLFLLYCIHLAFPFWKTFVLFWTQTALFTIGGSYTVLPYVAKYAVVKLHWLSKMQMIDGFALAETTPGPLIIVVAFVGFLAGYHQFGHSIVLACTALVVTTYYTFLPCFFYIFLGGPMIERSHANVILQSILHLVTASIVGMIVNLAVYLGRDVVISRVDSFSSPNVGAILWISICLVSILKFNVKTFYLIVASLLFGLAQYYKIF